MPNTIFLKLLIILMILLCNFSTGFVFSQLPGSDNDGKTLQSGLIWSSAMEAMELDIVRIIDEQNVLVGTFDLKSKHWTYDYKNLMLVDLLSAQTIWSIERKNFFQKGQRIICSDPVIIIHSYDVGMIRQKYSAIDVKSGSLLWEKEFKSNLTYSAFNPVKNELIVANLQKYLISISCLDIFNGKSTFDLSIDSDAKFKGKNLHLRIFDDYLLAILDNTVCCIDLTSRKLIWDHTSTYFDHNGEDDLNVSYSMDHLIFYTNSNLEKINILTGEPIWTNRTEDNINNIAIFDEYLFLENINNLGTASRIECYDLNSFQKKWSFELNGKIFSPTVSDQDFLYLTTLENIYSLNKKSGVIKFTSKVPDVLCFNEQLIDNIKVWEDKVIVVREKGIAVFDIINGELLSTGYIKNAEVYGSAFNSAKSKAYSMAYSDPNTMEKELSKNSYQKFTFKTDKGMLKLAQANKIRVYNETQSVLNSPTSTSTERKNALSQNEWAITEEIIQANHLELQQAVSSLNQSIYALKQAVEEARLKAVQLFFENRLKSYENTVALHSGSMKGNYFIRPFYKEGFYLYVFDVDRCLKAEIMLAPEDKISMINFPCFTNFDICNNLLLVKGINMSKEQKRKYSWLLEENGTYRKTEFTCSDLLNIDLNQLYFESPEIELFEKFNLNPSDSTLLTAIKRKEKKKYTAMIKNGANVNATDEFGITALMYAAIIDDKKLIVELIKKGSSVATTDANFWNAKHFNFFYHLQTKSTSKLKKSLKY